MVTRGRLLIPLLGILGLVVVVTNDQTRAKVKDVFVSISHGSVMGTATEEGTKAAAIVDVSLSPSPTPSQSPTATPTPTASSQGSSSSKTSVTVNGKTITPDSNGNVDYHEEKDGSSTTVKINSSSNQ